MCRILTILSILLVVGLVGFLPPAHATLTLTLYDGTTAITVLDGGVGDINPLPDAVTAITSLGLWSSNVTTGVKIDGGLDLNSIDASSSGPAHLTITLSDDFSRTASGFQFAVGGTTSGTSSFTAEENNTAFATLGPFTPGASKAFSDITSGLHAFTGSYSLAIVADIFHPAPGTTSFDASLSPTPLPGTLLLLGTGLVGLAGYARRRQEA